MRERRLELAALEVRECAKPWPEADGDVCEAIDFLEYYARGAIELGRGRPLLQVPGERNEMAYVGRGVAAVISPWNFPLAIPCGMTSAALAAGNAVVLKPAEQSPAVPPAHRRPARGRGARGGARDPARAGEVGDALVRDPRVHVIAFTGSLPVGRSIVRAAAETSERHFKAVVAELGGKNCVIVDGDADLDEVVPAVIGSAFNYAGQKCSAASRLLVHEAIADQLTERLAGAVRSLLVGQARTLGVDVGPVIEREAAERVARYIEIARERGTIVAQAETGGCGEAEGWFATPTLAADLPDDSPVLGEEIFGPVLAVQRVRDVEHACDVVDSLSFALTGGLFTRDPSVVRRVRDRTPVGNLYVNRGITGAMVGRQPFGGNRLSGTGLKAGGPDYLLQFVSQHAVSENTMRHGLVV